MKKSLKTALTLGSIITVSGITAVSVVFSKNRNKEAIVATKRASLTYPERYDQLMKNAQEIKLEDSWNAAQKEAELKAAFNYTLKMIYSGGNPKTLNYVEEQEIEKIASYLAKHPKAKIKWFFEKDLESKDEYMMMTVTLPPTKPTKPTNTTFVWSSDSFWEKPTAVKTKFEENMEGVDFAVVFDYRNKRFYSHELIESNLKGAVSLKNYLSPQGLLMKFIDMLGDGDFEDLIYNLKAGSKTFKQTDRDLTSKRKPSYFTDEKNTAKFRREILEMLFDVMKEFTKDDSINGMQKTPEYVSEKEEDIFGAKFFNTVKMTSATTGKTTTTTKPVTIPVKKADLSQEDLIKKEIFKEITKEFVNGGGLDPTPATVLSNITISITGGFDSMHIVFSYLGKVFDAIEVKNFEPEKTNKEQMDDSEKAFKGKVFDAYAGTEIIENYYLDSNLKAAKPTKAPNPLRVALSKDNKSISLAGLNSMLDPKDTVSVSGDVDYVLEVVAIRDNEVDFKMVLTHKKDKKLTRTVTFTIRYFKNDKKDLAVLDAEQTRINALTSNSAKVTLIGEQGKAIDWKKLDDAKYALAFGVVLTLNKDFEYEYRTDADGKLTIRATLKYNPGLKSKVVPAAIAVTYKTL